MTSVTVTRIVEAPPAAVFSAFLDPDKVALWWGPDDGPVLSAQIDARSGGRFHIRFRVAEDNTEHSCSGIFDVLESPTRLGMTWNWDGESDPPSRVDVTLRAVPGGTEVTLVHSQLDDAAAAGHQEGWAGALDKLVAHSADLS